MFVSNPSPPSSPVSPYAGYDSAQLFLQAIAQGDLTTVDRLIPIMAPYFDNTHDPDLNPDLTHIEHFFLEAVRYNQSDIVARLMAFSHLIHPTILDNALVEAAKLSPSLVDTILARVPFLSTTAIRGALQTASRHGKTGVVDILLRTFPRNITAATIEIALTAALGNNHTDVALRLLNATPRPSTATLTTLFQHANQEAVENLRSLVLNDLTALSLLKTRASSSHATLATLFQKATQEAIANLRSLAFLGH